MGPVNHNWSPLLPEPASGWGPDGPQAHHLWGGPGRETFVSTAFQLILAHPEYHQRRPLDHQKPAGRETGYGAPPRLGADGEIYAAGSLGCVIRRRELGSCLGSQLCHCA